MPAMIVKATFVQPSGESRNVYFDWNKPKLQMAFARDADETLRNGGSVTTQAAKAKDDTE
jgi:hypothetical protein